MTKTVLANTAEARVEAAARVVNFMVKEWTRYSNLKVDAQCKTEATKPGIYVVKQRRNKMEWRTKQTRMKIKQESGQRRGCLSPARRTLISFPRPPDTSFACKWAPLAEVAVICQHR